MKIIVGSASDRKINAVAKVLGEFFIEGLEVKGVAAKSAVPETPWDKETFDGARNRALDSQKLSAGANYYIGLESGLIERYGHVYEEAWCCVLASTGEEYYGFSSGLKVPDYVLAKMDELGLDHSNTMEQLEKLHGHLPNDTWGTYSGGKIAREISLEEALRNAFVQIAAPDHSFYKQE